MKKITVLGIGNILLTDEGVGIHILNKLLNEYQFPPEVKLLDGGNLGMGLLTFIEGSDKLLIIDAISGEGEPGTIYEFAGDKVLAYFRNKISAHELGIQEILATLEVIGKPITETVVVGVQPLSFEIGLELTPTVSSKVDSIVEKSLATLKAWNVEVIPNVRESRNGTCGAGSN